MSPFLRQRRDATDEPVVQAMAHLNLVMIHPFRDGNGRMARALQTLVLATKGIAEPEFASIEEWLGANTDDYYRVLAATGRGEWAPGGDAHLRVKLTLRAHRAGRHRRPHGDPRLQGAERPRTAPARGRDEGTSLRRRTGARIDPRADRPSLDDPYPWMPAALAEAAAQKR